MPAKPIIVGTDGSAQSRHAAGWAARQAALRGAPLLIVSVISVRRQASRVTLTGDTTGVTREMAERALAETARSAQQAAPGLTADTLLLTGAPALELTRQGQNASMLVIGCRGAGGRRRRRRLGEQAPRRARTLPGRDLHRPAAAPPPDHGGIRRV